MRRTTVLAALVALAAAGAACEQEEPIGEAEVQPVTEGVGTAEQPAVVGTQAALAVDTLEGVGPYVTDGAGRALYMFTADTQGAGESACYDACAEAWPPFIAPQGNPTAAVDAVHEAMIGTIQRRDGSTQVTYHGWPLYYYVQDTGPGMATGQDVHGHGGEWYLVQPSGDVLRGEG